MAILKMPDICYDTDRKGEGRLCSSKLHTTGRKKLAVINDFCGFGRCSIAVALPIISAMHIQCCPLPTAIFPITPA